jgi:putative flippase GtrA
MKSMLMSWLSSLGVGVVTAIVGALVGGWIANLAVTWQKIPSREGGSAYFVFYLGILAAIAGLIIGLVVSRLLAHGGPVPVLRAMALATLIHLSLIGTIGGITRLLSHVPPTIEGEQLLLAVELSWPDAPAPRVPSGDDPPHIALAIDGATHPSDSRGGMLWPDDARRESGRYILPGVVEVWTERKARMLSVNTGTRGTDVATVQVPLPRRPGSAQRAWSEWLPAGANDLRYRFRVVKRNEPARTQVVGPFTIGTMVESIDARLPQDAPISLTAHAQFLVTHNGAPVRVTGPVSERDYFDANSESKDSIAQYASIGAVAVIPGTTPALVVQVDASYGSGYTYVITSTGAGVKVSYLSHCGSGEQLAVRLGSGDTTSASSAGRHLEGLLDEQLFHSPGLYLAASAVFDTRTLRVHRVPLVRAHTDLDKKAPLSLSPDERRYVRIANGDSLPVLTEITISTGATRSVPLRFASSPTGNYNDVDGAWFDHYFAWEPDADGELRVTARPNADVMPRRGTLLEKQGSREYRLEHAKAELGEALIAFLESAMSGVRGKVEAGDEYRYTEVSIGTDTVTVSFSDEIISVWANTGANTLVVANIARKFDAALATRRYDKYFGS